MSIREVHASAADRVSAQIFFDTLFRVYGLEHAHVLDAFARNGQLTVTSYVNNLINPRNQLMVWEQDPAHEFPLKRFTPQVTIGDSYQLIRQVTVPTWDVLVIDTPQGLHTDSEGIVHAEHWDFLTLALPTLRYGAVVVLYVNKNPYDATKVGAHGYDTYPEYDYDTWMQKREQFYGFVKHPAEEVYIQRYRQFIEEHTQRGVEAVIIVPCHSDVEGLPSYAFRLALVLA